MEKFIPNILLISFGNDGLVKIAIHVLYQQ